MDSLLNSFSMNNTSSQFTPTFSNISNQTNINEKSNKLTITSWVLLVISLIFSIVFA